MKTLRLRSTRRGIKALVWRDVAIVGEWVVGEESWVMGKEYLEGLWMESSG